MSGTCCDIESHNPRLKKLKKDSGSSQKVVMSEEKDFDEAAVVALLDDPLERIIFHTALSYSPDGRKLVLALTDTTFCLLSAAPPLGIESSHTYFELRSCTCDDTTVTFSFPTVAYTFELPSPRQLLLDTVGRQIAQCCLPDEYPTWPGRPLLQGNPYAPFHQLFARFRCRLKQWHLRVEADHLIKFRMYLASRPSPFCVDWFSHAGPVSDVLLDSLLIERNVVSLLVESDPTGSRWTSLSQLVSNNRYIRSLMSAIPLTSEFKLFSDAVVAAKVNPLSELTFVETEFTPAIMPSVEPLFYRTVIKRISFERCQFTGCDGALAAILGDSRQSLRSLHFDFCAITSFARVAFSAVTNLSVRNCNLEVANVFDFISRSHLVDVDISGNLANTLMNPTRKFPESLVRVVADDIAWGQNLCIVFMISSQAAHLHTLSVCGCQLTDELWLHFFSLIYTLNAPNLAGLHWRDNRLHHYFCEFLGRASQLRFLSITGCQAPDDASLCKLIQDHPALKVFDFRGTTQARLTDVNVLEAISRNRLIEKLDLSDIKWTETPSRRSARSYGGCGRMARS
jgi:hypothetical protein